MSTVITDITHFDEFTLQGGGGVPQVNGNVGGRMIAEIEGYFYRAALGKYLQFLPDGTVTNINELDGDSWINLGFFVGSIITFEGTLDNDGTYVLTELTDRVLTFDHVFLEQTTEETDVYDDTPVTCVDFYYNLIENSEQENYYSKVDTGAIQRFSSVGYDLTGEIGNAQNMYVASESFGWVTNPLLDEDTGETNSEVLITNNDVTDHKQYFTISHSYFIAPFCLAEQKNLFENQTPPEYLSGGRSLKYIARVDGNTSCGCGTAEGGHTGSKTSPPGCVAWYNQNNKRTRAEYYVENVVYQDAVTAEVLDTIDINNVTSVSLTLKSRTGKFYSVPIIDPNPGATYLILAFTYFPLNTDRYIFTPDTLLRENFINDRCITFADQGITAGEFIGTDYQVLTNVEAVFVDANTIAIGFDVDFATALKTLFESLPEENRKFYFTVMTQAWDITSTQQSDRVNVPLPLNQIAWDKEITDLITPFDDLHGWQFPETEETQATTNIAGYEGDPVAVEFPFKLLQPAGLEPTILNAGFQIVATKAGKEDFVLEEKIYDVSLVRKLAGVQTIDIEETRDFKDMIDWYRDITFVRDSDYDVTGSVNSVGFNFHYPFVLRYEYWASLVSEADEYQYEIFEDIETTSQSWDTLQADGWALQVKFKAQAQAYDDYIQDFTQYWDITVATFGDAPTSGPTLTHTRIFEDIDEDVEVDGILSGKQTRITDIWQGDLSGSIYNSTYAYIFADYNGGGVNVRRFASSEFDSDPDSPFSSDGLDSLSGSSDSWASANVRISVFNNEYFIMQTIYDDRAENWTRSNEELLFPSRLGFFDECFILGEDGTYILDEEGQRIEEETCS